MNDLAEVIKGRRELVKGWLSRTLLEAGEQGVKVEEISELMGKSASLLYKAANIKETEQNLQAHDLIPVMERTGNFFILEELARLFGFALVPLGEPVEMLRVLVKALEGKG